MHFGRTGDSTPSTVCQQLRKCQIPKKEVNSTVNQEDSYALKFLVILSTKKHPSISRRRRDPGSSSTNVASNVPLPDFGIPLPFRTRPVNHFGLVRYQ